ncbi:PGF-pre-PGF domain-containing protein [Methanococcoides orientis]|nr:PGF-pre-PGF domain-containing protein [Methanococcoides orientis]
MTLISLNANENYDEQIADNTFDNTDLGIASEYLINTTIRNNTFDNTYTGIYSDFLINTTIRDNSIHNGTRTESGAGFTIYYGINNTIQDNTISLSPEGDSVGIELLSFENSTIMDNYVEGASVGLNISKYVLSDDIGSFAVDSTEKGRLLNNVPFMSFVETSSYHPRIAIDSFDTSIMSTEFEITGSLPDSEPVNYNNAVKGNIIKDSTMYGLYLTNSENTTIYNNYFKNFNNTMLDDASNNNTVWNIAKTSGTSIIDSPYIAGNYWVHPDGTGFSIENKDTTGDGISEKKYVINENNTDYLPLAAAFVEKRRSYGTRAYVGQSHPPEDVESTDSSVLRVTGGARMEYDFSNSQGPVLGISFDSKEDQGLVVGNVQVLNGAPAEVGRSPEGKQYQIMSITLGPEGTISEETAENIIINFQVTREWINENNIDLSTIRLMRFHDGEWQELPTTMISDDGEIIHFAAQIPGFSVFSIVGDEAGNEGTVSAEEDTVISGEPEEASTESTPGFTMFLSTTLLVIAAIVVRRRN